MTDPYSTTSQFGVDGRHGAGDRPRPGLVAHRHIVECAVRLHVLQRDALRARERPQRTDLIDERGPNFIGREPHLAASEPGEIGESRVCADADSMLPGQTHGALHHQRVAPMKAARDVGRGDHGHHRLVLADRVRAETFP